MKRMLLAGMAVLEIASTINTSNVGNVVADSVRDSKPIYAIESMADAISEDMEFCGYDTNEYYYVIDHWMVDWDNEVASVIYDVYDSDGEYQITMGSTFD